jgi:hypothetical protein
MSAAMMPSIMEILTAQPGLKFREVEEGLKVDEVTLRATMRYMVLTGMIHPTGKTRATQYWVGAGPTT